jgi:hypothetical protein
VKPELSVLNNGYTKEASKTINFLYEGKNVKIVFVVSKNVNYKKSLSAVRLHGYDESDVSTQFYFYFPENNFLGGQKYETLQSWNNKTNDHDRTFLEEVSDLEIISEFTKEQFVFLQLLKLRRSS